MFEEGNNHGELEVFLEVLHFIALQVRHIETLWEDSANVKVMVPDEVLHGVGESDFGGEGTFTFDVVQVLVRSHRHPETIPLLDRVKELKSL